MTDDEKFRIRYEWFGLMCNEMHCYLTKDEWKLLVRFGDKIIQRMGPDWMGERFRENEWPSTDSGRWDALK